MIARLALYMTGNELPFSFIVDDPAGNSFVENYHAPKPDPQMKVTHYIRTAMQVGTSYPTQVIMECLGLDQGCGSGSNVMFNNERMISHCVNRLAGFT